MHKIISNSIIRVCIFALRRILNTESNGSTFSKWATAEAENFYFLC